MNKFKPIFCNVILTIIASLIYYFLAFRHYTEKCVFALKLGEYNRYRAFFSRCGASTSQGFAIFSNILTWIFIPLAYVIISYLCSISKSENK